MPRVSAVDVPLRLQATVPTCFARRLHQQYLVKVPHGYDCHAETGIALPRDHSSGASLGDDAATRDS
jgi:hypothetical protein